MKLHFPMTMLVVCLALAPDPTGPGTAFAAEAGSDVPQSREATRTMAQATLERLYALMPEARGVVRSANGYAVFTADSSGNGFGVAIKNNGREETYMRIRVADGAGGNVPGGGFSQVWIFRTDADLRDFNGPGLVIPAGTVFLPSPHRPGAFSTPRRLEVYQFSEAGLATSLTMPETVYRRDLRLARVDPP